MSSQDWEKINYLEYRSVCADVPTGSETEAANEAGAQVGEDVPV